MIGNHAVPVIADAYIKGDRSFNADDAWDAVKHAMTTDHNKSDWSNYDKLGYFLAGLSMGMLNAFFSTFHNEIDVSVQSIINAVLLVLFLIYLANEQKIIGWFKKLFSKKNHAPAEQN